MVGVLFGVGSGSGEKTKVKIPALNRKNRDLERGTLGSLDTLEVPGSLGETFAGGTCPVSTQLRQQQMQLQLQHPRTGVSALHILRLLTNGLGNGLRRRFWLRRLGWGLGWLRLGGIVIGMTLLGMRVGNCGGCR